MKIRNKIEPDAILFKCDECAYSSKKKETLRKQHPAVDKLFSEVSPPLKIQFRVVEMLMGVTI